MSKTQKIENFNEFVLVMEYICSVECRTIGHANAQGLLERIYETDRPRFNALMTTKNLLVGYIPRSDWEKGMLMAVEAFQPPKEEEKDEVDREQLKQCIEELSYRSVQMEERDKKLIEDVLERLGEL